MTNDDSGNLISFRWDNHQTSFFEVLANLRANEIYTDVTLACEHHFVSAHKLVLSSCSDYFKEIFARAACISPVIILKDIRITELDALIDFMYLGETDVKECEVAGVLRAAECLKIKGLGVPDEHSKSSSSPTSSAVEAEIASPNKKMKLEDNIKVVSPAIKEEMKRKGTQHNFPYLTQALKLNEEMVARRPRNGIKFSRSQFRNFSLNHKNSGLSKSNREIKVIALPSSGKKVGLMTLKMNDPVSEYSDTKQFTADSLVNHCSNPLPSIHDANDSNMASPVYNIKDTVSDYHNISSQFNTALPRNDTTEHMEKSAISFSEMCVSESDSKQETTNMHHGDLSSINSDASIEEIDIEISEVQNPVNPDIMEEDESDILKLPNFSTAVQPYLKGETLSHKKRCQLRACIVEQLLKNFCNLDNLSTKDSNFYLDLENSLIKMYPNIVEDQCKKRAGHLGSLIQLLRCEHKKATKAKTS